MNIRWMNMFMPTPRTLVAALVAALCGLLVLPLPAIAGREALQNDVFARPVLTAAEPAAPAASEPVNWHPALRAIVQSGARSMVLVERSVVELGGKIDGYQLIHVADDKAVFAKGGRRVELILGKDKVETR